MILEAHGGMERLPGYWKMHFSMMRFTGFRVADEDIVVRSGIAFALGAPVSALLEYTVGRSCLLLDPRREEPVALKAATKK